MAEILMTLQMHFFEWKKMVMNKISLKYIFKGPADG